MLTEFSACIRAHSLLSLTSGGVANASSFYPKIATFDWLPGSQTGAVNVILYNSGNITVRATCQRSSCSGSFDPYRHGAVKRG